jgi:mono/diheme cytochrome c family protein
MRRLAWTLALVAALGALVPACERRTPGPGLTALERRGAEVFERQRCLGCHVYGMMFTGDEKSRPVPDLRKTPVRTHDWYVAYLLDPRSIRPKSPMSPLRHVSQADIDALVAYLRHLSRDAPAPRPEAISPGDVPAAPPTVSAYRSGRAIYGEHCAGCHGELGNGGGPVGHLLFPEPRDFTDVVWMDHASDLYLFSAITNGKDGTAMPAFRSLLTPGERALVLRYVRYFADPVARERMEQGFVPPLGGVTTARSPERPAGPVRAAAAGEAPVAALANRGP